MYSIVGCNQCEALWIVADRPATTTCPRCNTTHQFDRLRTFVETDDLDAAQRARGIMLANRHHEPDAADEEVNLLDLAPGDHAIDRSDEPTYPVEGDPPGPGATDSPRSRRDIILTALTDLDHPTPDNVEEYAAEHGVPPDYVHHALEKLRRAGKIGTDGTTYRLL